MSDSKKLTVNGREIEFTDERNLLEVIRQAGIDLPTFCYHSELSIYGACRLCLVEVTQNGRSMVMAACSTAPAPGMVIQTETKEIRDMRKISVELLLANHNVDCPTCVRSSSCALQNIARRLGVETVRYETLKPEQMAPLDLSSPSLQRDPNKCIKCGDCVRVCSEIQSVGALYFTNRGSNAKITTAFDKPLCESECVNCGQCAAVCPTGAIVAKQDSPKVWEALYDKSKTVVVQVAPAVRVALGEYFGAQPGEDVAGKLVTALKLMGFKHVYDTSFTADMTIFEEATEFLGRVGQGGVLPLFTSCCPAWVRFMELYYPDMLPNLSSCRSPQAMFGAVAKKVLPAQFGCKREDMIVVSIMPCTAKKYEAKRPEFETGGQPEVDIVITTDEVARMINSLGINLKDLEPSAFDMPMGFATGAGVIFGASGGVMEAALRYAAEKLENKPLENVDFTEVRGMSAHKAATLTLGGTEISVAVVHGLAQARALVEDIRAGRASYHFIEVMACPGGCVSGAGQPIGATNAIRKKRQQGLYTADKAHQIQKSQDNYLVARCYEQHLGGHPGSHEAHKLLHTHYQNRSQLFDAKLPMMRGTADKRLPVTVTICDDQDCNSLGIADKIAAHIQATNLADRVDLDVAVAPTKPKNILVSIGQHVVESSNVETAFEEAKKAIDAGVAAL
ncbi:MAG: [FeFe] hydrogenase, group A [Myxococcales bacterium]|jgi:NADH-quinone oxidoreductase subunit G|nr:[FeFe] hydrogenase, group A [Myxococcales bacterium]